MNDRIAHMSKRTQTLSRSLHRFVVTGSLTVAIDALVYVVLLKLLIPTNVAKCLSLLAATLFAYFANKLWAFSDSTQPTSRLVPFLCLYASAILLNIAVNGLSIAIFGQTIRIYRKLVPGNGKLFDVELSGHAVHCISEKR